MNRFAMLIIVLGALLWAFREPIFGTVGELIKQHKEEKKKQKEKEK